MPKQKYNVTGMTCSACSAHVEKAVRRVAGVRDVTVNLLTNSMVVEADASLPPQAITAAVEKAGYGASPAGQGAAAQAVPVQKKTSPAVQQMADMKKRLIVSFVFLVPLMYVSMGSMAGLPLPGFLTGIENGVAFGMVQLLLALPIAYVNRKYYQVGFKTLFHLSPNMDSLIAIGSTAAFAYGIFAIMRIGYGLGTGDTALAHQYHMDLYFESAAMILALITLGKYLEAKSKGKTSEAIEKLIGLAPKTATVVRGGEEHTVPVEQVQAGDIIAVKPGQSIPVDGVVVEGATSVDEAAITGESIPVEKSPGSTVLSASINTTGSFRFRATKVGQDTTLSQIIRLVEEASASKAPIAKLADKIAGVFVPVVIGIALAATVIWLAVGQTAEFALSIGIAVLVVSCPCALGLATPVAIMVGTGKGAENGILIKSGEALETAHSVNAVVLDKTGTLTNGRPVVTDVLPAQGFDEAALTRLAASLEKPSEHPLAGAVLAYAKQKGVQPAPVEAFEAVFGKGVQANLAGRVCLAGNAALLAEAGIELTAEWRQKTDALSEDGKTPLLFAEGDAFAGIVAVADTLKETSVEAVRELQAMGIEVTMLTGDNARTAAAIQKKLGIAHVVAQVLPQDKARHVAALRSQGRVVAMVGDGVNDAPALAGADVGMAIGAGTDVAIESADVVLMKNDLRDVPAAIRLSKAVIRNIKENLFWAFFYNTLGIPLAAGVFYSALGWKLSPMFGAAAMSLSSVFVVSNALRLKRFDAYKAKKRSAGAAAAAAQPQTIDEIQQKSEERVMKTVTLSIEGMMCQHCVAHVTKALSAIEGVTPVVDLEKKNAVCTVEGGVPVQAMKDAVEEAGYTVTAVE
ncbi:MAG: copper-translocating P-type ATPase [Oscillospiraceae bacterium]|nr:MAG: copper-translocating P-type ATPase [Oscillospiraceae bacterium]